MSTLSVMWFLFRAIPKPIRATYPCQQAAFPLLSATVVWLLGLKGVVLSWLQMTASSRFCRRLLTCASLVLMAGIVAWAVETAPRPGVPAPKALTLGSPSGDPPNSPMGFAKGIFPGRVTWARDTNATPWKGAGPFYWWEDTNGVNQVVVDRMISANLRALTGTGSDSEAWDKIFRYYNVNHSRGDIGYSSNEIVAIKINLNNVGIPGSDNYSEASKQTVIALLRQLVNRGGIQQTNITVYDAVRALPLWIYYPCQAEFPGVQWYNAGGGPRASNTWIPAWVTNSSCFSVSNACGGPLVVPNCVSRATYLINLPLLKGHIYAGVTLAAKNHYGSIPNREHGPYLSAWQANTPLYSMLVDLMGSRELGGKTILYVNDALFGNLSNNSLNNRANCGFTNLFDGEWSASIFMSLDPVAIDSVGVDFLYSEFGSRLGTAGGSSQLLATNCDHYLHEAALADNPPSGTRYQPDGVPLKSLGVHEHWNNPIDKQYSRNLSTNGTGIELVALHQIPPALLTIISPTNGAALGITGDLLIQAAAVTNYSAITRVDFYANGTALASSTNGPFETVWTNAPWGHCNLVAIGTDADGYCTTSAVVQVDIGISLAITNPPSGLILAEGTNLPIQARIISGFGPITQVSFHANQDLIGSRTQPPYDIVWSNMPPGIWALNVVATDLSGASATSAVVTVESRRDIRVALLQPVSGSVFPAGSDVPLYATARSIPTDMVRVDFYGNGALIATTTNSPYTAVFTNPPPGVWSLAAVATETGGFSRSSPAAQIAIKPAAICAAGTLYVDLQITNCARDGTTWTNVGALGNFSAGQSGQPVSFQTNAAGTFLPAAQFTGASYLNGPLPGPDLEEASDRSLEIWVFRRVVSSDSAMMMWGWQNHAFIALYDFDPYCGAFAQVWNDRAYGVGWNGYTNVPLAGAWHHFVYVYDGATNMNVYVDGALRATNSFPGPLSTGDPGEPGMVLGRADTGGIIQKSFSGFINSVRVHGGVLSPNDVLLNYLAGPCEWNSGPLAILEEPADLRVTERSDAAFSVVASDPAPLGYQWYTNGTPVSGATSSTFLLGDVRWSGAAMQLSCLVFRSNSRTSFTGSSRIATLTVVPQPPVFTDCAASNAVLRMTFTAVTGGHYRLESADNLNGPVWSLVNESQAVSNTISMTDLSGKPKRFYRVIRTP